MSLWSVCHKKILIAIAVVLLTSVATVPLQAQPAISPAHKAPYSLDSGLHEGIAEEVVIPFRTVVRVPGATWLRLHFSEYNLGTQSYITITSLEDGAQQRLDAKSLPQWRNSTAFFNGDAVEIELNVSPGEEGVFFRVNEVTIGEPGMLQPESQCGSNDDRVSSTDSRVGRTAWWDANNNLQAWCTGWIVSNGLHLTAGHCSSSSELEVLQFNVPPSDADGTPNHPGPEDQYPVDQASINFFDDGDGAVGNDWGVFYVSPNSNTGLLPVHAQGSFFRMSRDLNPATVRVTGYGVDDGVDNQTLQTHSGSYLGETVQGVSDVFIEYLVDTMGGNSGSPVIDTSNGVTIGIHTNGGCDPPSAGNIGTSFENDNLENAIQTAPGTNVEYVDKYHPIVLEDGTVFRPFDTVAEAVTSVPSGGIISIVKGSYPEVITIDKAVTLTAPVGTVTIGQ